MGFCAKMETREDNSHTTFYYILCIVSMAHYDLYISYQPRESTILKYGFLEITISKE